MRTEWLLTAISLAVGSACIAESETDLFDWSPSHDGTTVKEDGSAAASINPRMLARFRPLPTSFRKAGLELSKPLVELGKRLYHDKQLSADGTVACASCHDLARGGTDGQPTSLGVGGQRGGRNSPTVLNAAGNFRQFWDGRAATVEEQAGGPILNPIEMAMPNAEAVERVLRGDASYRAPFAAAFPRAAEPVTFVNATQAIAAFERTLSTRGRWDDFLEGDEEALSAEERKGLKTFLDVGCMVCHTGSLLGGSTFERVGVVEPWPNQEDQGRFGISKQEADRMVFKVPTLRNVLATAPYFHDGSSPTIEDAIRKMGKHQLGIQLEDAEVSSIAVWFGALGGELATEEAGPGKGAHDLAAEPTAEAAAEPAKAQSFPLRDFMRGVASPALDSQDFGKLRKAFTRIGGFAPGGEFSSWSGFVQAGLAAASAEDIVDARAACAGCHNKYQERYRAKLRTRPL